MSGNDWGAMVLGGWILMTVALTVAGSVFGGRQLGRHGSSSPYSDGLDRSLWTVLGAAFGALVGFIASGFVSFVIFAVVTIVAAATGNV